MTSHAKTDRYLVAAEPLEPRIAPAGIPWALAETSSFSGAGYSGSTSDLDLVLAAQDSSPQPPAIFGTENLGTILDTHVSSFDTQFYKGTVESIAVRRTATADAANFPIGGIDFYYQVNVTSGDPTGHIDRVALSTFAPFDVSGGLDPRIGPIVSTDPLNGKIGGARLPVLYSFSAGVATFDFAPTAVGNPSSPLTVEHPLSAWMVLRTTAHAFKETGSAALTGSEPASVAILAPAPEPPGATPLVVTGAGTGSLVQVFDRNTGALKESFSAFGPRNKYGVRVATGDVNGDGVEDIIVGSGRGSVGGAQVRVFDGADPNHAPLAGVLGDFRPFASGILGAVNVAAGDVNGDGRADIIVSPASGSLGQVRVFSGADGSLLSKFTALSRVTGGVRVAAGDLDGDGEDEVIVGAGIGSAVKVFDGLTGLEVAGKQFQAFARGYKGGVTVAAGDVNGDGVDEIIVGSAKGTNLVRIFDHTLTQLSEFRTAARHGVRLAAADVNGDGFADIIAGKSAGDDAAVSIFDGVTKLKVLDLSGYNPVGKVGSNVG